MPQIIILFGSGEKNQTVEDTKAYKSNIMT